MQLNVLIPLYSIYHFELLFMGDHIMSVRCYFIINYFFFVIYFRTTLESCRANPCNK